MAENSSSMIKVGAGAILTAALIALAISVFAIGRTQANSGTVSLIENAEALMSADMQAYNQTEVSGSDVLLALDTYGKSGDFAILVNTVGIREISPSSTSEASASAQFVNNLNAKTNGQGTGEWRGVTSNSHWAFTTLRDVSSTPVFISGKTMRGTDVSLVYRNYGAVLGVDTDGGIAPLTNAEGYNGCLVFDNGGYVLYGGVVTNGDSVLRDRSVTGVKQAAALEYIAPAATFRANLIIADTGEIVGLCFTQAV